MRKRGIILFWTKYFSLLFLVRIINIKVAVDKIKAELGMEYIKENAMLHTWCGILK